MRRRTGLQAEVLASLAVVMALATAVLGVVLVRTLSGYHGAREERLQAHLVRALWLAAEDPAGPGAHLGPDAHAWSVSADGRARARSAGAPPLDETSRALAEEARRRQTALFRLGSPNEPIRLAAPRGGDGVVTVVRLPAGAASTPLAPPELVVLGLLLANAVVFTFLGVTQLRRRVILPLRRLAEASRAMGRGGLDARVPVEGARELAELSEVFNDMGEALERRTIAYEKAVCELRDANRRLRQARAGLDRAERLASVGSLAAGVAHEVGNPMGALLAFLDLVARDVSLSDAGKRHLAQAREQGARVRVILRQLLDFSRPPQPAMRAPIDLGRLATETVALVRAQRRYTDVAVDVAADPAAPPALADPSIVAQILLNLLLNAAEALRERAGPRVELRVRAAPLELRADDDPGAARGRRRFDAVECRIADNGPGIPDELAERIFDPFFTTKPPGEGTGLGLANALRLAEELGGRLDRVAPQDGEGAVFSLRLPAAGAAEAGGASRRAD